MPIAYHEKPVPMPVPKPVPQPAPKPVPVSAPQPAPTPNNCSFTDPKKAAALGNVVLATFWEDILKTNCTESAIWNVFDDYFDEDVVVTINDAVFANNLTEFKNAPFSDSVVVYCNTTDSYFSWVTFNATIDSVETDVVTIATNRVISSPRAPGGQGRCGYGYFYTAKFSGENCNQAKVTVIRGDGMLPLLGLPPCP